jgi:hypothetical protein
MQSREGQRPSSLLSLRNILVALLFVVVAYFIANNMYKVKMTSKPVVIVVGSGLAGLSASIEVF